MCSEHKDRDEEAKAKKDVGATFVGGNDILNDIADRLEEELTILERSAKETGRQHVERASFAGERARRTQLSVTKDKLNRREIGG